MVRELGVLFAGLTLVTGFIIPEELPSLLSLLYSNIPPIKKGTDSRVGFGFRLGPHADFQILLEVGPQTKTAAIGPDADPPGKRETLTLENPQTLLEMVNNWKMPLGNNNNNENESNANNSLEENIEPSTEKPSRGGWIEQWRNAFAKGSSFSKIQFKPVAGIDYRVSDLKSAQSRKDQRVSPVSRNYVDQLTQLYRQPTKIT